MEPKFFRETLAALGFPLVEADEKAEAVNSTLAEVVKSGDLRLWEGFSVMLANSAKGQRFDYEGVRSLLKSRRDVRILNCLVGVSLALYKVLRARSPHIENLLRQLEKGRTKEVEEFEILLRQDQKLPAPCGGLSGERLKNVFLNYYEEKQHSVAELLSLKDSFDLQYALSQIFSERQKELILKKLRGDVFTKTEREYYSRDIKKKLLAIANTDLQKLARKLL
jgi:hypothetical protein